MDALFEIAKDILPVIITGIITFLITKYTYNNNRPLDKLEIAYNRVYYPLYKLVNNQNNDNEIDSIIEKAKFYIDKYNKYIDKSTIRTFNSLCKCETITKKRDSFRIFKDNIYDKNSHLRRRLGYLEPNILQIYTYSSRSEKSTIRILVEIMFIYLSMFSSSFFIGEIQLFLICLAFIVFIILIIELICKFIMFLYYSFKR